MDKFKMISPSLNKIKGIPSRANVESAIQNNETRVNIPIQKIKLKHMKNLVLKIMMITLAIQIL